MIHTVCTHTGDRDDALAARSYAIEVARLFQARLRVVSAWGKQDAGRLFAHGADPEQLSIKEFDDFFKQVEQAGLSVETSERGEGFVDGFRAEAQESDLIVLGAPEAHTADKDTVLHKLVEDERALLRRAECALLVVRQQPRPVKKILVHYHAGIEGKSALRFAGEFAAAYGAQVGVLSIDGDIVEATQLAVTAKAYLKGFPSLQVETLERVGAPGDPEKVLTTAASWGADWIVVGEEPHSFLTHFLNAEPAEDVALSANLPVLIAR